MNDIFDKLHFPCPAGEQGAALAFRDDAAAQLPYRNSGSPERHARPDVHEHQADDDDDHVRHHAREDLVQRYVLGGHSFK